MPDPSIILIGIFLGAVVVLALLLLKERQRNTRMQYEQGFQAGQEALRRAIHYEQEIFDCRRTGLVRRETLFKIRERVLLENLRIAETEREIVINTEVDLENVWESLERINSFTLTAPVEALTRKIAPPVRQALRAMRK